MTEKTIAGLERARHPVRISRLAILLLLVLAFLQNVYFAPLLPEQVASHFDTTGQADGRSSKTAFVAFNLASVAGIALLFLGITAWLAKVPPAWINLPHKDYWLAPERRAATLETIQRQMEWLAAATVALLLGIAQLTIQANLNANGARLEYGLWLLFGSYLAYFVVWLVWMLRKWYARPPLL